MGVVEEVGPEVKTIKKGDRVVEAFDIACGSCSFCKDKLFSECDTTNPSADQEKLYGDRIAAFHGYSHLTGGVSGGQAQYARCHHGERACVHACICVCAFVCGMCVPRPVTCGSNVG